MSTGKYRTTIYLNENERDLIQERAKRAQLSTSTYLARAGSIVNIEDVVKYPLTQGVPAVK